MMDALKHFIERTIIASKYGNKSNPNAITPKPKPEPEYIKGSGWHYGYPFSQFWGNCHALLGDTANQDGYQQLCHHYYLQNGSLSAKDTVARIKKLLGE